MKKAIAIILLSPLYLILSSPLGAQNLVVDPSFEDVWVCPLTRFNAVTALQDWSGTIFLPIPPLPPHYIDTFEGHVDLFHTCSEVAAGAPLSALGYQWPRTGESYVGFYDDPYIHMYMNNTDSGYARSYAQGMVNEPLIAGQEYHFSVWLSRPDAFQTLLGNWAYAFQKIGSSGVLTIPT